MDPVTGGIAVNLGASLLGQLLSSGDKRAEEELLREAERLYGDISAPTLQRVLVERLGPSAMEAIPDDMGNKQARNRALEEMMNVGLSGGMDAGSMLAMEQGRRAAAAHEVQGRGAIRSEMQRRGLGGAGEAALQQQAQQAGAHSASMSGLSAASDARARALSALETGGGMAGQAERDDFSRAAAKAQSMDAINRFNAEQSLIGQQFNAGQQQREWDNNMGVRDRQYGAKIARAGQYGAGAQRQQQMWGGLGQAAAYGLSAYGQGRKPSNLQGPPGANKGTPDDPWW